MPIEVGSIWWRDSDGQAVTVAGFEHWRGESLVLIKYEESDPVNYGVLEAEFRKEFAR